MSIKKYDRYVTAISVLQDLIETDNEGNILNPIVIYLKEKAQDIKKQSSIEEIEVNDAKQVWFIK